MVRKAILVAACAFVALVAGWEPIINLTRPFALLGPGRFPAPFAAFLQSGGTAPASDLLDAAAYRQVCLVSSYRRVAEQTNKLLSAGGFPIDVKLASVENTVWDPFLDDLDSALVLVGDESVALVARLKDKSFFAGQEGCAAASEAALSGLKENAEGRVSLALSRMCP